MHPATAPQARRALPRSGLTHRHLGAAGSPERSPAQAGIPAQAAAQAKSQESEAGGREAGSEREAESTQSAMYTHATE